MDGASLETEARSPRPNGASLDFEARFVSMKDASLAIEAPLAPIEVRFVEPDTSPVERQAPRREPGGVFVPDMAHPDTRELRNSAANRAGTEPAPLAGMRLRTALLHVAALATAGCSSSGLVSSSSLPDASPTDGAPADAAPDVPGDDGSGGPEAACGGCNCGGQNLPVPSGSATPDQACLVAQGLVAGGDFTFSEACNVFCAKLEDSGAGGYTCTLPQGYADAYLAAQDDGGAGDGGADAGPTCPAWSGDVIISCGYTCLGRRTDGVPDPGREHDAATGALLAERVYLEAVSVHAFARLERELAAHGAPPSLLRDARRARRDEIRHTAMMARLARRHGAEGRLPEAPAETPVRDLFAIALENAVEGCVRETYGAVVGLVEARASRDAQVRRAMRSIGADECRHAELAWAVAAWILPRLNAAERAAIDRAVDETVAALERDGDARVVRLLASRVWGRIGGVA